MRDNRAAWNLASRKYVEESQALLSQWRVDGSLVEAERVLLGPILAAAPVVVHLQSGNGFDDLDLFRLGARQVVGVDFSQVAATSARGRAIAEEAAAAYVVADAQAVALRAASADLVYTGKGALMWLSDLPAWGREARRLVKPGGSLFVYDAHPLAALWTSDTKVVGVRRDVDYFGGTRRNDSFPASAIARFALDAAPAAVESQWPLAAIITAVAEAGFRVQHLGEYAAPFWRPAGPAAAAWNGNLPNSFSLLATADP